MPTDVHCVPTDAQLKLLDSLASLVFDGWPVFESLSSVATCFVLVPVLTATLVPVCPLMRIVCSPVRCVC